MTRLPQRLRRALAVALGAGIVLLRGGNPAAAQSAPFSALDANSRFTIQLLIDSAETIGLPTHALMSRALEGIAKKADSKRIVEAVRRLFGNLRTARESLGGVGNEEIEAAAAVLEAGAKPAQVATFRTRQKGRSDLEAFIVWADLITRGVSSEDASSAITKLWQDGADGATFYNLWSNVQSDISLGLNPGAALQNRIREAPGRAPQKISPPEGQEHERSR